MSDGNLIAIIILRSHHGWLFLRLSSALHFGWQRFKTTAIHLSRPQLATTLYTVCFQRKQQITKFWSRFWATGEGKYRSQRKRPLFTLCTLVTVQLMNFIYVLDTLYIHTQVHRMSFSQSQTYLPFITIIFLSINLRQETVVVESTLTDWLTGCESFGGLWGAVTIINYPTHSLTHSLPIGSHGKILSIYLLERRIQSAFINWRRLWQWGEIIVMMMIIIINTIWRRTNVVVELLNQVGK